MSVFHRKGQEKGGKVLLSWSPCLVDERSSERGGRNERYKRKRERKKKRERKRERKREKKRKRERERVREGGRVTNEIVKDF